MTYTLPTDLYLSVDRTSATASTYVEDEAPKSSESWSLVLRASPDTNIVLSGWQRLADVDIQIGRAHV